MERRIINPWSYAEKWAVSHAFELTNMEKLLICCGQAPVDAEGAAMFKGDMSRQITQSLNNVQTLLETSGYSTSDIVRMIFYVTDVDAFMQNVDVMVSRMNEWGVSPPGVLCGCARLADPDWLIEIEVMAAK